MNTKDYFKDIYQDFFGIENMPKIEVKHTEEKNRTKDEMMSDLFAKIDDLYLTEESQNLLKQMIEYMRKYQEKIENHYIPFDIVIQCKSDTLARNVMMILAEACKEFAYTHKSQSKIISLLEKNISLMDMYQENGVILFKDLSGLQFYDGEGKKVFFHHFQESMNAYPQVLIIVQTKNEEEQKQFFMEDATLQESRFSFVLKERQRDVLDVYQSVLTNIELNEEMHAKVLDYISATYPKTDLDFETYQEQLLSYLSFHKNVPEIPQEKSLDEVFASLNELVGLQKVKNVLHELVDMMTFKEKAGDQLKLSHLNLHMVFLGNPGTGKTTVARIVCDILYHLGYIKQNKLIEVSAKDLVAEYVGQTAPKTNSVIESALGGVLFIDEAYSLAVKDASSYNAEAIATLIQAMENKRDNLVVIFAGYTKEMQDFLNSNSGIVSRIGYTLEFDDYSEDELVEIFVGMMKKSGFVVQEEAILKLRKIIQENLGKPNFGNARFVRNIYEKTLVKHASNVKDKKRMDILKTITEQDISTDHLIM